MASNISTDFYRYRFKQPTYSYMATNSASLNSNTTSETSNLKHKEHELVDNHGGVKEKNNWRVKDSDDNSKYDIRDKKIPPTNYTAGIFTANGMQKFQQQAYLSEKQHRQVEKTKKSKKKNNTFAPTRAFMQKLQKTQSIRRKYMLEEKAWTSYFQLLKLSRSCDDVSKVWKRAITLAWSSQPIEEACWNLILAMLHTMDMHQRHLASLVYMAHVALQSLLYDLEYDQMVRQKERTLLAIVELCFIRLYVHYFKQHQITSQFYYQLVQIQSLAVELQTKVDRYAGYIDPGHCSRLVDDVTRILLTSPTQNSQHLHGFTLENETMTNEHLSQTSDDKNSQQDICSSSSLNEGNCPESQFLLRSPTLHSALEVWCIRACGKQKNMMAPLINLRYKKGMVEEFWLDKAIAIRILAEVAKSDIHVLETLQCFAVPHIENLECTHKNYMTQSVESLFTRFHELVDNADDTSHDIDHSPADKHNGIMQIYDTSPPLEDSISPELGYQAHLSPDGYNSRMLRPLSKITEATDESDHTNMSTNTRINSSTDYAPPTSSNTPLTSLYVAGSISPTMKKNTNPNHNAPAANGNSDIRKNHQGGIKLGKRANRHQSKSSAPVQMWGSALATIYADCLAHIATFGKQAVIRKTAIIGCQTQKACKEGGLLWMSSQGWANEDTEDKQDVAWPIRYAAVKGLSFVAECSKVDTSGLMEGFYNTCWQYLNRHQFHERNGNVTAARQVGVASWKMEQLLSNLIRAHDIPSTFAQKLATSLSKLYPPPDTVLSSFQIDKKSTYREPVQSTSHSLDHKQDIKVSPYCDLFAIRKDENRVKWVGSAELSTKEDMKTYIKHCSILDREKDREKQKKWQNVLLAQIEKESRNLDEYAELCQLYEHDKE